MLEPHPGRKALQHFARVLEQKPTKDDHALSLLTQCLAPFRAELIERSKGQAPTHASRECLTHLNAVIGVVLAMHFPIGQPPWEEFEKAQGWLETLVERAEGLQPA